MLLNVGGGHVWIGEIPTTADGRRTDGEDLSLAGKLTARGVESFAKRKGRYGDGDGLFLRVMDPGKRVYWTFRYRMNGQDREMSVGPYPELSLAQARDRHLALRNAVKVDKTDPLGDRRAAKTAVIARSASAKPTFGQCAEQFIALNEGAWRSRKNAAQWRQSLARHCQPIWSRPVDLITAEDVLAVLEPIWPTVPETASRVRGPHRKILNAARVAATSPPTRPTRRDGRTTSRTFCRRRRSSGRAGITRRCPMRRSRPSWRGSRRSTPRRQGR